MKLVALNKGLDKYGYSDVIGWNTNVFNGHQKGICIGVIEKLKEGEELTADHIVENHLPLDSEDRDQNLLDIIKDKNIVLVSDETTQRVPLTKDGTDFTLLTRERLYLPYAVEGHSVFQPTVNFENVDDAVNTDHHVKIELCFVINGLNRYIVIGSFIHNVPVMELVNDFLDDLDGLTYDAGTDETLEELRQYGIMYKLEEETEDGEGFYLDFYDEAGNRIDINITLPENNLKAACVSARLISIITEIKKDW